MTTYKTGVADFDALLRDAGERTALLSAALVDVIGQGLLNDMMGQAITGEEDLAHAMVARATASAMEQSVVGLCAPFLFEPVDPAHWFEDGTTRLALVAKHAEVVAFRDGVASILGPLDAARYTHSLADPVDELACLWPSPLRPSASFVVVYLLSLGVDPAMFEKLYRQYDMEWIRRYVAALWRVSVAFLSVVDEALDRMD